MSAEINGMRFRRAAMKLERQQRAERHKERIAKRIRIEKARVRRAIAALSLPQTFKRVLQVYANQFFHDRGSLVGGVAKTLEIIAKRAAVSIRTVRSAIREFEFQGYLDRLSAGRGGRGVGTVYAVDLKTIEQDANLPAKSKAKSPPENPASHARAYIYNTTAPKGGRACGKAGPSFQASEQVAEPRDVCPHGDYSPNSWRDRPRSSTTHPREDEPDPGFWQSLLSTEAPDVDPESFFSVGANWAYPLGDAS